MIVTGENYIDEEFVFNRLYAALIHSIIQLITLDVWTNLHRRYAETSKLV